MREINKKKTYYEILEIANDADIDTIKRSYRRLAMKYHPDRNKEDPETENKFKEIAQAYETLSDENKKARYDMKLKYGGGVDGDIFNHEEEGEETFGDAFDIFNTIFKQFPVSFFPMDEFFPSQQPKIDIEFSFQTRSVPNIPISFINLNNVNANDLSNMQNGFNLFNNLFQMSSNPSPHTNKHKNDLKKEKKEKKKAKKDKKKAENMSNNIAESNIHSNPLSSGSPSSLSISHDSNINRNAVNDQENAEDYDIVYNINVKLEDIYQRKVKNIVIQRHPKKIKTADETNKKNNNDDCNHSDNDDNHDIEEQEQKEIEIHFDEKEKIYKNEGDYEKGDLHIYIHPKKHPYYEVMNDYDLLFHYSLTIEDIIEIRKNQTEEGYIYMYPNDKIKLDPNEKWCIECETNKISQHQNTIKIKEKGLWNENKRGDLIIVFDLQWSFNKNKKEEGDDEMADHLFEFTGKMANNGEERWNICEYYQK